MNTIVYKRTAQISELEQIITLQAENALTDQSSEEKAKEGFVSARHSLALLQEMNEACPHIIAKIGDEVVGYALVMLPSFKYKIEMLIPMFEKIEVLFSEYKNYVVMGQICIAKEHRKKGIFKGLYNFYKTELESQFSVVVTEVATLNQRSLQAHHAVGFLLKERYKDNEMEWDLVYWDWK